MKTIFTAVIIFLIAVSVNSQTLNIKPYSMGEADKDNKYSLSTNSPPVVGLVTNNIIN